MTERARAARSHRSRDVPGRAGRRVRQRQVDVRARALRADRGRLQRLLPRPGRRRRERPVRHRRTPSTCSTTSSAPGCAAACSPSSTPPTCSRRPAASLVELARSHDVLADAIVLDVPEAVAVERNAAAARPRLRRATSSRRQHRDLRRSLRRLRKEGFRRVHVLRGVERGRRRPTIVARAAVERPPRRPRARSTSSATCTAAASELRSLLTDARLGRSATTTAGRSTPPPRGAARRSSSATSSTAARTRRACCAW